jgi:hypothetical protein
MKREQTNFFFKEFKKKYVCKSLNICSLIFFLKKYLKNVWQHKF